MERTLTPDLMKKLDCRYCAHWHSGLCHKEKEYYICRWEHCEAIETGYDARKLYPSGESFRCDDAGMYDIGRRQEEYGKRIMRLLLDAE